MNKLELKVPPPIVTLVTATLMWLTSRLIPGAHIYIQSHVTLAIFIACVGLVFEGLGILSFVRAKTTVNPMRPAASSSLVIAGVYRLTRNPMYLGLLLDLLAWAIYLSNGTAPVFLVAFVLYVNKFQIKPEERALAARFGAEYESYKAKVRRWL